MSASPGQQVDHRLSDVSDPLLNRFSSGVPGQRISSVRSRETMAALPPDSGVHMFVLLRRWQDYLAVSGRAAETTRLQYLRYVLQFLAHSLVDVRVVTEDDVVEYLATLDPHGAMRGMVLRALKSLCGYLFDRELIARNPVARLNIPKRRYGEAPALTAEQLQRVFAAAGDMTDLRARPTLELMYGTGARIGSMVAVLPKDVDLVRDQIYFRQAKGDAPYTVPLSPEARAAAEELLRLRDWKPPRAESRRETLVGVGAARVQQWCEEISRRTGIEVWPHLFRHTFAMAIANDPTIPDIVWIELMNHSDGRLLRRYARGNEDLRRAAVVVAGWFARRDPPE